MPLRINNTNFGPLNNLNRTDARLKEVTERLSTGQRVNKAKDDAAALAISEALRADIRLMDQGVRNASDAVSLLQTAEGGLGQSTDILARMDELAMASGGVALSDDERQALDEEYQQLQSELDRLAEGTTFNGQKLLDGSFAGKETVIGIQGTDADKVTISIQSNPGPGDQSFSSTGLGVAGTSIATASGAESARSSLESARSTVLTAVGGLGALQNRFETAVNGLETARENIMASESQIRDADVALEVTNLVRERLLSESGRASLIHSNLSNERVLDLL
ncbi:MAG: flagellin FliC [Candidatus Schekmanbacteria bacterium]|nr:flagellin FliC [Candidatus Schekmanbacteria bacterium]